MQTLCCQEVEVIFTSKLDVKLAYWREKKEKKHNTRVWGIWLGDVKPWILSSSNHPAFLYIYQRIFSRLSLEFFVFHCMPLLQIASEYTPAEFFFPLLDVGIPSPQTDSNHHSSFVLWIAFLVSCLFLCFNIYIFLSI